MQNWIVETLTLVRRYAAENGFENLTDEMDIALLVAVEEIARREEAARGRVYVGEAARDCGEVVVHPRPFGPGRCH